MKPEKEIKWLSLLYSSKHCRYFLKNFNISYTPGCISDFARLFGCSSRDTEFRAWFKTLEKKGIFIYKKDIRKGHRNNVVAKGYIIEGNALVKYARTNSLYSVFRKFFSFETL